MLNNCFGLMNWRNKLYEEYVCSGQAAGQTADVSLEESSIMERSREIRSVINRFVPKDEDTRILDLGCGHGDFIYHLTNMGYEHVEGVDISQEQIDFAHRIGVENVTCSSIDKYLSKKDSSSVDVTILFDVVEHMSREQMFEVMGETFRVLDHGGRCLMHVPNALGLYGMRVRYADLTHEIAFTPKSVRQMLSTVGFSEVDCYGDPPNGRFRRILWEVSILPFKYMFWLEKPGLKPILTQNIFVVAYKN
jgi:2-polyprenyl-3-methyl-5-hydroxy-6-metoxy-1,4-benzoquinol methylase